MTASYADGQNGSEARSGADGQGGSNAQRWLEDLLDQMWRSRLDFYNGLIDKVAEEKYPSLGMLDMIEEGMPPEMYPRYIDVLLGKITASKYPSLGLMRRLQRLTDVPMPSVPRMEPAPEPA